MDTDLYGCVALVTGGGRGNGREIARSLASHGAQVIVNDIDEGEAAATAELINDEGGQSLAIDADVSDEAEVLAMVQQGRDEFGSIDILVNNAGIGGAKPMAEIEDLSRFDEFLDVHLKGAVYCIDAVLDDMMEQEYGKIVNLTSIHTKNGIGMSTEYDVAKYGLLGLTKTLALDLGTDGVRVNAVAPGWVNTRMTEKFTDQTVKQITDLNPLSRFAEPEEIAEAVTFLASPASDYINGHELRVDGGQQPIDRWKNQ